MRFFFTVLFMFSTSLGFKTHCTHYFDKEMVFFHQLDAVQQVQTNMLIRRASQPDTEVVGELYVIFCATEILQTLSKLHTIVNYSASLPLRAFFCYPL